MLYLSSLHVHTLAGEIRPLAQVLAPQPGMGSEVALRFQEFIGNTPAAIAERKDVREALYIRDNTIHASLVFPDPEAEKRRADQAAARLAAEEAAQAAAKQKQLAHLKAQIAQLEGKPAAKPETRNAETGTRKPKPETK